MGLIQINNRNNFLLGDIPNYHPESTKYKRWWRGEKTKCIEGFWGVDDEDIQVDDIHEFNPDEYIHKTKKWRFITPALYFYSNFGTILHKPPELPKTSPKIKVRPTLRDVDWEIYYDFLEARGFSGFENDTEYTCCRDVYEREDTKYMDSTCFKEDGTLKEYKPAFEYLRQLHEKPLGKPLYRNGAKNYMILATRGLGKSYSVAGVIAHELLFDGLKYYKLGQDLPVSSQFVGSGIASKSADLLTKVKSIVANLPGVWKPGTAEMVPSPFFKQMSGSVQPSKTWIHEYDVKTGSGWTTEGTGSHIKHGVWTTENPEAAAGGRYALTVCEEVGLTSNILTIHGSNEAAMAQGTSQTGSSIYIGTGGNMEKIIESEILFKSPDEYNMLSFDDGWENSGKICRFFPVIYKDEEFKDGNGNTDVEAATRHYEKRREKKSKSKDRKIIQAELTNYPMKPSEMFMSKESSRFPTTEIKMRLGKVLSDKILLDSSWKGHFSLDESGKSIWELEKVQPITEFPFRGGDNINGCVEIYEMPKKNSEGVVPWGIYIAGLDPVDDDDNSNNARSLQSCFVMNNLTGRIVAEYTGRTKLAHTYYEQVRRLLLFYNAQILYENQKKGFYGHMANRNCTYLLAETPDILVDKDMAKKNSVGNKAFGVNATDRINEYAIDLQLKWLAEQAYDRNDGVTNLDIIRSVGYLKEAKMYRKDLNTDRISSMGMLMILRENTLKIIEASKKQIKTKAEDPFFTRNFNKGNFGYKGKSRIRTEFVK